MASGGGPYARLPERLGKYPIRSVLGEGAMGMVYRGHDPVIEREVAIKTIRKELLHADSDVVDATSRFRNEARAVGRLSHPGIVAIYEYGEDEQIAFIAMEFVEGRNLSQVLATRPPLDELFAFRIMDQLLDALECAHGHGVWHRDIKPANLILTTAGQLKLTDFGIARIAAAALTLAGSSIGTPGYMAPEQYTGESIDHRVDLFACGVLLYRLLSGTPPFAGTPEAIMYKILSAEPAPPSSVPGAVGGERYDHLLATALRKSPAERFESARAMRQALGAAFAARAGEVSDATVIIPAGRRTLVPGAAVGADSHGATGSLAGQASSATKLSGTTFSVAGWDPSVLRRVEQVLTTFVGPIARVLVRQAAGRHSELQALQEALAAHVDGDLERRRFLTLCRPEQTGATPGSAAATNRPGTGSTATTMAPAAPPVAAAPGSDLPPTPRMVETAGRVLAMHIGPIAKVIVRRVLATNPSQVQFAERLAVQASDGNNEARLLAELRQAMG